MADEAQEQAQTWRILVVDDKPHEGVICATALQTVRGYEVRQEKSARRALAIAREWRPDLAILDIKMPEMDGLELARRLRADDCDANLIFVTSSEEEDNQVVGVHLGDGYIVKPHFKARVFLAQVEKILKQRKLELATMRRAAVDHDQRPQIDELNQRVHIPGRQKDIDLTRVEMKLLRTLIDANGQAVSYDELIRAVWLDKDGAGAGVKVSQTDLFRSALFANISRLRKKIELDRTTPQLILTVQHVGYRYHLSAG
jgi:two-component system, OmpR family, response regulator